MARDRALLYLSLAAMSAGWGSSYLFYKLALPEAPPLAIAFLRGGLAAAGLAAVLLALGRRIRLTRTLLLPSLVFGAANGWVPNSLTAHALLDVDSATAGMLNAATPLATALLAHVAIREERLAWRSALGVGVGFCGVFLLIGPDAVLGGRGTLLGSLLMLGAACSYAVATVAGRRLKAEDPEQLALGQFVVNAVGCLVLSLAFEPGWRPAFSSEGWAAVIVLGVGCSVLPSVLFFWLLGRWPASSVATVSYLIPLWSTVLGVAILGERPSATALLGGGAILLGVWIATSAKRPTV
ncbi:MAG: DMT family transporter [Alphaproteobacteria bacterium]|nr:DMT family transporter [Alphaproteobacteria bacterium]